MGKRQRFTAEFKREAIRLMQASTKPAATLARELGVSRNRIYEWLRMPRSEATKPLEVVAARRRVQMS